MNRDERPDVLTHNREAWNKRVDERDRWTCPVSHEEVERARSGSFDLLLTPTKPVPRHWFPPLDGLTTLCLASGGGQQGPLLAAAGGVVTVFDNSPRQLEQDRFVAEREQLEIRTVEGDMADLSDFADESFGLIVHPCANCYAPKILPVWRECFRVLRPEGVLLAGFCNPVRFIFEDSRHDNGVLEVRYPIPHSDLSEFDDEVLRKRIIEDHEAFEFGHSLGDQIGGQLQAGFLLRDLYEDKYVGPESDPISNFMDTFLATCAIKP